eukprot:6178976-Pleurochrysis_carterae.AAC.3
MAGRFSDIPDAFQRSCKSCWCDMCSNVCRRDCKHTYHAKHARHLYAADSNASAASPLLRQSETHASRVFHKSLRNGSRAGVEVVMDAEQRPISTTPSLSHTFVEGRHMQYCGKSRAF